MKAALTVVLSILIHNWALAASCTTLATGDFSDPSIWSCGSVPGKNDDVTVNHSVELDVDFSGGDAIRGTWVINVGGALTNGSNFDVSSSGSLTIYGSMEVSNMEFRNGSHVEVATGGTLLVTGNLTNLNNSNDITVDGTITVNGNFDNGNGSVVTGAGSITVDGNFTNNAGGTVFNCVGTGCDCSNCILGNTSLPIALVSFEASLTNEKTVKLTWTTSTEINNDFFTIERSTNGLTFIELAEEAGAGNSNEILNYQYTDENPQKGAMYYRLKQTDYDGQFTYSPLVAVSYDIETDGSCVLKVYPNPCKGNCNVALSDCKENEGADIKVEIVDALGNRIQQYVPNRSSDGSFTLFLDKTNYLTPGMYIVRAASIQEQYSKNMLVK